MTSSLLSAFLVGLFGGVHCLGMCGGIATTLSLSTAAAARLSAQFGYNLGRILGYGLIGALAGGLGEWLLRGLPLPLAQRLLYGIAGACMIAIGLYLGDWWRGLARIEAFGGRVWRRIAPLAHRLLPIRHWWQALGVGLVWAWLPCGLVYSVLIWALAAGGAARGGALLLAFGLGTLPTLLGIGLLAGAMARLAERRWPRQLAGLLVIGFGLHAWWQLLAL